MVNVLISGPEIDSSAKPFTILTYSAINLGGISNTKQEGLDSWIWNFVDLSAIADRALVLATKHVAGMQLVRLAC